MYLKKSAMCGGQSYTVSSILVFFLAVQKQNSLSLCYDYGISKSFSPCIHGNQPLRLKYTKILAIDSMSSRRPYDLPE